MAVSGELGGEALDLTRDAAISAVAPAVAPAVEILADLAAASPADGRVAVGGGLEREVATGFMLDDEDGTPDVSGALLDKGTLDAGRSDGSHGTSLELASNHLPVRAAEDLGSVAVRDVEAHDGGDEVVTAELVDEPYAISGRNTETSDDIVEADVVEADKPGSDSSTTDHDTDETTRGVDDDAGELTDNGGGEGGERGDEGQDDHGNAEDGRTEALGPERHVAPESTWQTRVITELHTSAANSDPAVAEAIRRGIADYNQANPDAPVTHLMWGAEGRPTATGPDGRPLQAEGAGSQVPTDSGPKPQSELRPDTLREPQAGQAWVDTMAPVKEVPADDISVKTLTRQQKEELGLTPGFGNNTDVKMLTEIGTLAPGERGILPEAWDSLKSSVGNASSKIVDLGAKVSDKNTLETLRVFKGETMTVDMVKITDPVTGEVRFASVSTPLTQLERLNSQSVRSTIALTKEARPAARIMNDIQTRIEQRELAGSLGLKHLAKAIAQNHHGRSLNYRNAERIAEERISRALTKQINQANEARAATRTQEGGGKATAEQLRKEMAFHKRANESASAKRGFKAGMAQRRHHAVNKHKARVARIGVGVTRANRPNFLDHPVKWMQSGRHVRMARAQAKLAAKTMRLEAETPLQKLSGLVVDLLSTLS